MTLNVTDALKYSCNTFFYTVGQKLTGEHLEQWTKKFGLGTATGIAKPPVRQQARPIVRSSARPTRRSASGRAAMI